MAYDRWKYREEDRRQWIGRYNLYLGPDSPFYKESETDWETAFGVTSESYRKMKALCDQAGADFMAVFINHRPAYDESFRRRLFDLLPELKAGADFDRPLSRLKTFLKGQDIPYLDLTGAFRDGAGKTGRTGHFHYDGHWNAEGHRWAAGALETYLLERFAQREEGVPAS